VGAGAVDASIVSALDDAGRLGGADLRRVSFLLKLLRATSDDRSLRVQEVRLAGLRLSNASALIRLGRARPLRRRALRLLAEDPTNLILNYVLGRWYLGMPKVLGGSFEHAER